MTLSNTTNYSGPIKLVVTDLAGTTMDYGSCAPAGAFAELFSRHGIEATQAQAREPMGMHKRDHIRIMTNMPEISKQWEAKFGAAPTEKDVEDLFNEFIPMQTECLPNFNNIIPGVVETATKLRERGIKIAATTGYNVEMMNMVLTGAKEFGFQPDVAFSAAEVPAGRPAPWLIYRGMEATGVYPTESVVKIGDTVSDVEAGLNAGVWSIGVTRTGNMLGLPFEEAQALPADEMEQRLADAKQRLEDCGAHYVVESFSEIFSCIDDIESRLSK